MQRMQPIGQRTVQQVEKNLRQRTKSRWQKDETSKEPSQPKWRREALGLKLSDDSRVKCPECMGAGSPSGPETRYCSNCQDHDDIEAPGPCPMHKCRICGGSGMVCPTCRGMRFVRMPLFVGNRVDPKEDRCPTCTEGNNWNPQKEEKAITRYTMKHGGR